MTVVCWLGTLADDNLISAQQAKDRAGLLIQQIQIEIVIRQPVGEIFHLRGFAFQLVEILTQRFGLGLDLDPPEQPEVALHGGKGKICAECECNR